MIGLISDMGENSFKSSENDSFNPVKQSKRWKRGQKGQAFIELAICLVFLLTLLAGVIDVGWLLYSFIALQDSAQEGAVFASMCQNTSSILDRTRESTTAPLDINDIESIDIVYLDEDGNEGGTVQYGYTVRVTLSMKYHIVTPFVGAFLDEEGVIPIKASATSTIMHLETYCR